MLVDVSKIIAYENNEMTQEEVIEFFQELIDTGHAWRLQGHYGRTALRLIEYGYCRRAE
tara:strand:- start:121 stop:297 length:177 start_codon:yes stop_codon:yes gene_type:complete